MVKSANVAEVADKWVVADHTEVLGCDGATLECGETYRERVPIFGSSLENHIDLTRRSESGDNLYRLTWRFVEEKTGRPKGPGASKRSQTLFGSSCGVGLNSFLCP